MSIVALLIALSVTASVNDAAENVAHRTSSVSEHDLIHGRSVTEWRRLFKDLHPEHPELEAAVGGLLNIVKDSSLSTEFRRQAAMTAGRLGDSAAAVLPVLGARLAQRETDASTIPWVCKALAQFGPRARDQAHHLVVTLRDVRLPLSARVATLEPLVAIGANYARTIPTLMRELSKPQPDLSPEQTIAYRGAVIESLGLIGATASPAVPTLLRELHHEVATIRRHAVLAIGRMGPGASIAVDSILEAMVFDASTDVRDAASIALAGIGAPSVNGLVRCVEHGDAETQTRAMKSLATIGPAAVAAGEPLQRVAKSNDPTSLRLEAALALWSIAPERNRKTVARTALAGLVSEERMVRVRAANLIVKMGSSADPWRDELRDLQEHPRTSVRRLAARVLRELDR